MRVHPRSKYWIAAMDRFNESDSYMLTLNEIFSTLFKEEEKAPLNVLMSTLEDVSINL